MYPGFLKNVVYPALASGTLSPEVSRFWRHQPSNVKRMLEREAKKFNPETPNQDSCNLSYLPTTNPDVSLCKPESKRYEQIYFYSCPYCQGRLFRGMKHCGWCGESVFEKFDSENVDDATFVDLVDYLMDSRVTVASILPKDSIIADDLPTDISDSDVKREMQGIRALIPVNAFADDSNVSIPLPSFTVGKLRCRAAFSCSNDCLAITAPKSLKITAVVKNLTRNVRKKGFKGAIATNVNVLERNNKFSLETTENFSNFVKRGGLNA